VRWSGCTATGDVEAITAAGVAADLETFRSHCARPASDLMIAATAAGNQLPLYTANPDDFKGAESFVEVVGIQARPSSL